MQVEDYQRRVRRAYEVGVSGKEAFELELERLADAEAKEVLEQAERDDAAMPVLRDALEAVGYWYQSKLAGMAASAVLAMSATLLIVGVPSSPKVDDGLTSSNVLYLETVRSADATEFPAVVVQEQQEWLTLITYPAFGDYEEIRVEVDRLLSDEARIGNPDGATWEQLWKRSSDTGNKDSLVVVLGTELFGSGGVFRLGLHGKSPSDGTYQPAGSMYFRVHRTSP